MNVGWFILKLVNCLRKTCGWSMRQLHKGSHEEFTPRLQALRGALKARTQAFLLPHRQVLLGPAQGRPWTQVHGTDPDRQPSHVE